jgi:hypothetical protein
MVSEVISFRFSEAEIQALSTLQQPNDKSLNQTAARLLRELMAGNNPDLYTESSTASTSVNNVDKEEIKSELLAQIFPQVNQLLSEFREEILGK